MVDAPLAPRWRVIALGVGGCLLGIISFFIFTRALILFVVWLGWLASGSPGTLQAYGTAAASFELPIGHARDQPRPRPADPDQRRAGAVRPPVPSPLACIRCSRASGGGSCWRASGRRRRLRRTWVVSRIGQPSGVRPRAAGGWYLLIVLLTSPLQAAAEEYFFRGYLMQALHTTAPAVRGSAWSARPPCSPCSTARRTCRCFCTGSPSAFSPACWWSMTGGLEAGDRGARGQQRGRLRLRGAVRDRRRT